MISRPDQDSTFNAISLSMKINVVYSRYHAENNDGAIVPCDGTIECERLSLLHSKLLQEEQVKVENQKFKRLV